MRGIWFAVILALLGGCGKPPQARITLKGETPLFGDAAHRNQEGFIVDSRKVEYLCPSCLRIIEFKKKRCRCESDVDWPKSIHCKYCSGSGVCPACVGRVKEPTDGKCAYCKGDGYNFWGEDCVNCLGKKDCPICGGTAKCDYCEGKGRISLDRLRQLISRPAFIKHEEPEEEKKEEKGQPEEEPKKDEEKKAE